MARVKGFSRARFVGREALRNALVPTLTLGGVQFTFLVGGTVLVEKIFSYPGSRRALSAEVVSWTEQVRNADMFRRRRHAPACCPSRGHRPWAPCVHSPGPSGCLQRLAAHLVEAFASFPCIEARLRFVGLGSGASSSTKTATNHRPSGSFEKVSCLAIPVSSVRPLVRSRPSVGARMQPSAQACAHDAHAHDEAPAPPVHRRGGRGGGRLPHHRRPRHAGIERGPYVHARPAARFGDGEAGRHPGRRHLRHDRRPCAVEGRRWLHGPPSGCSTTTARRCEERWRLEGSSCSGTRARSAMLRRTGSSSVCGSCGSSTAGPSSWERRVRGSFRLRARTPIAPWSSTRWAWRPASTSSSASDYACAGVGRDDGGGDAAGRDDGGDGRPGRQPGLGREPPLGCGGCGWKRRVRTEVGVTPPVSLVRGAWIEATCRGCRWRRTRRPPLRGVDWVSGGVARVRRLRA